MRSVPLPSDETKTPLNRTYSVTLPAWSGPLDLLLDLIHSNNVNIYDIPIKEITSEYLKALLAMQRVNIDIASEFLVMASRLVYIKSKMLLPTVYEEDEKWNPLFSNDPRDNLVEELLEYQRFKEIAKQLEERSQVYDYIIERQDNQNTFLDALPKKETSLWKDVSLFDLIKVFSKIVEKMEEEEEEEKFDVLRDEIFSVHDQMIRIESRLAKDNEISFYSLFKNKPGKEEIVVTFWALLELYKQTKIAIRQHQVFGDIFVFRREPPQGS